MLVSGAKNFVDSTFLQMPRPAETSPRPLKYTSNLIISSWNIVLSTVQTFLDTTNVGLRGKKLCRFNFSPNAKTCRDQSETTLKHFKFDFFNLNNSFKHCKTFLDTTHVGLRGKKLCQFNFSPNAETCRDQSETTEIHFKFDFFNLNIVLSTVKLFWNATYVGLRGKKTLSLQLFSKCRDQPRPVRDHWKTLQIWFF